MKVKKVLIILILLIIFILFNFLDILNSKKQQEIKKDYNDFNINNIKNYEIDDINNKITLNEGEKNMEIEIENKIYKATVENNETAKAFIDLFPLSINMSELNGNEKYYYLPFNIKKDIPEKPEIIRAGDIMLYSDNCIVIFYKTFRTSYNYVRIGHIDDFDFVKKDNIFVNFKFR